MKGRVLLSVGTAADLREVHGSSGMMGQIDRRAYPATTVGGDVRVG